MAEIPDDQLLATLAGGRSVGEAALRQALEMLYDRHADAILHCAQRQLRDAQLAEDVLQDVFVTLLSFAEVRDTLGVSLRTAKLGVADALRLLRGEEGDG